MWGFEHVELAKEIIESTENLCIKISENKEAQERRDVDYNY